MMCNEIEKYFRLPFLKTKTRSEFLKNSKSMLRISENIIEPQYTLYNIIKSI